MQAMRRKYSDDQLRQLLSKRAAATSQRALADELGVPPSVLCDTIKGNRAAGPSLIDALGLKRIVYYVEQ
jgi:hypothetical protein